MPIVEAVLAMIAACIGFALIARRTRLPYSVMLVLGGMAIAFIPGIPQVELDPQIALAFFLPPLLQGSAFRTDWREFRHNLRPILFLAVGAVLFTALCIGAVAKWMIPDLPWAAAIALGAIVAPPDAVAATSILQRLRIPRRIVTVLEGESLVNDATALVLYRFAVAAMATAFSPWEAAAAFVVVGAGGIAIGWLGGRAAVWAIPRLRDTLLEVAATFVICFAVFLAAEAVHASGVMAVVTAGLVLGRAAYRDLSANTRQAARAVWGFIEFILNSLVFILIGLQLNAILDRIEGYTAATLIGLALLLSAVLIVSRFLWVVPASWLLRLIPAMRHREPLPPWSHTVVICWAGMRGVVSLAAALALPLDFPARDLLVFLAFCAILATLVLQGTTLGWVIRRLRIEEKRSTTMPWDEAAARTLVAQASLAKLVAHADDPLDGAIARDIMPEYRDRVRLLDGIGQGAVAAERTARLQLRLQALRHGRDRLVRHHAEDGLDDEILHRIGQELDLEELRLRRLLGIAEEI
ncbi:Na+/H+ antiporter [Plastoroseomonas hellenica]|uniref:Na+/H+ antiporter n=1 Tax=Plastoroseomonas hellenica TaxID=2687306 RepID=A0ABS5F628_9PROT|nr:Na+/H+ antiporter [Plastoroseomonas hellenica]MBR0642236.1 Na+/H+ antiporter [Plastoroseomonas hellenica]MBR0668002.1 Na+/H+ antiporter [Plastoroseomonas hellenica]